MKIAVLYICTGKYTQFFRGFYDSAMHFLMPDEKKSFFVWTDDDIIANGLENVTVFHKECQGFPADSLFRFEMFMQAEKQLECYDYIYFFNANAEFKKIVNDEILPDSTGLAMGLWRGAREHQHPMFYPYERNPKSLAYIPPYGDNYKYFMGGLNGGTSEAYLKMIRTLAKNIRDDYQRGIIAIYHDESHINAYMRSHECKIIPAELNCPEESPYSNNAKMIFREKTHIDSYFNKDRGTSLLSKMKKAIQISWRVIRWYLRF